MAFYCDVDYVKGFGGKFGVQTDRQDKCALGWDHQEKLQLHESQKGTFALAASLEAVSYLSMCCVSAVLLSVCSFVFTV
jgi:hypothetical protein